MKKGGSRCHFSITKKSKKMEQTTIIKEKKQLEISTMTETPFGYSSNNNANYITCGKVLYETGMTKEEAERWLKEKPWDAISLLCQAIAYEMIKNKN